MRAAGCRRRTRWTSTTSSPSGPFKVTILRNGTEIAVSFVPDADAAALLPVAPAAPVATAVPAPIAPAVPPARRRLFQMCRRLRRRRASSRPYRRAGDRSPVPLDGRRQGVRSASIDRHAAAGSQGWPHPAARSRRRAADPRGYRRRCWTDHARDRIARSSRSATTPTSPTRSRAWRASAPTCSPIARAAAPCSASFRRRF